MNKVIGILNDLDDQVKMELVKSDYLTDYKIVHVLEKKEAVSVDALLIVLNSENEINDIVQWLFFIKKNNPQFVWIVSKVDKVILEEILLGFGANYFIALNDSMVRLSLTLKNYLSVQVAKHRKESENSDFYLYSEDRSFQFAGQSIRLTRLEYRCLDMLYKNINTIVSYEDIFSGVWNRDVGKSRIANLIACLRRKLELNSNLRITNVSSKGYVLQSKNS